MLMLFESKDAGGSGKNEQKNNEVRQACGERDIPPCTACNAETKRHEQPYEKEELILPHLHMVT